MAVAAAIILRKERDIVNIFRSAGAISAGTARDPDQLGINHRVAFNLLLRRAVLRDAGAGRYYLDELSWTAACGNRRRLAFALAIVMAMFLAVLVGMGVVTFGSIVATHH
jgi:hypothetical protein